MSQLRQALPTLDATQQLATILAPFVTDNAVVALSGPVGAGKTTFTGMLCTSLGIVDQVSSPTYTLANSYTAPDGTTVAHLDLYRIETMDEQTFTDIEPYLDNDLVIIEWPAVGDAWLAEATTHTIELEQHGDGRTAAISGLTREQVIVLLSMEAPQ